jgi:hypothetical protein
LAQAGVAALGGGQISAFGGALLASDDHGLTLRLRGAVDALPAPPPLQVAGRVSAGHLRALLSHPSAFGLLGWATPAALLQTQDDSSYARLHPAQAEALRVALATMSGHLSTCRERAAQLRWTLPTDAWRQDVPDGALPSWSRLLVRSRDPMACAAAARSVGVNLGLDVLHDLSDGCCPHAARAAAECVALPCHRHMRDKDIERVTKAVEGWLLED